MSLNLVSSKIPTKEVDIKVKTSLFLLLILKIRATKLRISWPVFPRTRSKREYKNVLNIIQNCLPKTRTWHYDCFLKLGKPTRHSIFPDIKAKIGHTYIASNTLHHFVSKEWPNLVAINLLTANPTNCLRVFDHVVGLELKRLRQNCTKRLFLTTIIHFLRLQTEFLKVLDFAETKFCINTKFSIYLVFVSLTSYSNINTSKSQVLNKKSITIRYNWPENHVNLVPLRFVWDHFWRLFLELEIMSL